MWTMGGILGGKKKKLLGGIKSLRQSERMGGPRMASVKGNRRESVISRKTTLLQLQA